MGHDDVLGEHWLRDCVAALEKDPDCLLAYSGAVLIDQSGAPTSCYVDSYADASAKPIDRFWTWMRYPTGLCNPVYALVRRDVLAKTVLMGKYMGSDRVLLGELALRGRSVAVAEGHFQRRVHPKMSTAANRDAVSLTQWFTGRASKGLHFKRWRQFGEYLAMINRVENLGMLDRWRARAIVFGWMIKLRAEFIKEVLVPFYVNGRDTTLKARLRRLRGEFQS